MPPSIPPAVLAQLATTLPLVGLIWTIQLVHYPLFDRVGAEAFARYHADHARLITPLVGPLMVVELLAAMGTVRWPAARVPEGFGLAMLALVGVAWATTALLSVPAHNALAQGFDAAVHARLVGTNAIRTAAWTARGALLLWALTRAERPGG